MESDVITLQELFAYKVEHVTADRVVVGSLVSTGLRPTFLSKSSRSAESSFRVGLFQESS